MKIFLQPILFKNHIKALKYMRVKDLIHFMVMGKMHFHFMMHVIIFQLADFDPDAAYIYII